MVVEVIGRIVGSSINIRLFLLLQSPSEADKSGPKSNIFKNPKLQIEYKHTNRNL